MKERRKISKVEEYQITYTDISPSRGWCTGPMALVWAVNRHLFPDAQVEERKEAALWWKRLMNTTLPRSQGESGRWPVSWTHVCREKGTCPLPSSSPKPSPATRKHQANPTRGPPCRSPDSQLPRSSPPGKPEKLPDPGEPQRHRDSGSCEDPGAEKGQSGKLRRWDNAWASVNPVIRQHWFIHSNTCTLR